MGEGGPALVLEELRREWPGLEVTFRSDDIRRPTDWRIHDRRHSVVVHLGGHMQRLETELDGFGGSSGPAMAGEVWTAPAERRYASHACGTEIRYAVLRFEPDIADTLCGSREGRRDLAARAGFQDAFLLQAVRRLQAVVAQTDDVSELLAQTLSHSIGLHMCLAYAPGSHAPRPTTGPSLSAATARHLREFIHDRLRERITLGELATQAGMTTHHLLVAFRKAFGNTPAQYVIQQRLRCAMRQLVGTSKDITAIALDSGFSSHSHLTASFSRYLGKPPSAFRKAAAQTRGLS